MNEGNEKIKEYAPKLTYLGQGEKEPELKVAFTVHDFEEIAERAKTFMNEGSHPRYHLYITDLYKAANALALTLKDDEMRCYSTELQGNYYNTPLRNEQ